MLQSLSCCLRVVLMFTETSSFVSQYDSIWVLFWLGKHSHWSCIIRLQKSQKAIYIIHLLWKRFIIHMPFQKIIQGQIIILLILVQTQNHFPNLCTGWKVVKSPPWSTITIYGRSTCFHKSGPMFKVWALVWERKLPSGLFFSVGSQISCPFPPYAKYPLDENDMLFLPLVIVVNRGKKGFGL